MPEYTSDSLPPELYHEVHLVLEIDQARLLCMHTAKALDDPNWIPVNVIVDEIVAVLQVLPVNPAYLGLLLFELRQADFDSRVKQMILQRQFPR